jgi:hypothetical protein
MKGEAHLDMACVQALSLRVRVLEVQVRWQLAILHGQEHLDETCTGWSLRDSADPKVVIVEIEVIITDEKMAMGKSRPGDWATPRIFENIGGWMTRYTRTAISQLKSCMGQQFVWVHRIKG